MFASSRYGLAIKELFIRPLGMASKAATPHGRSAKRIRCNRSLQIEGLENRDLFSISGLWFSGNTLVVASDDAATNVTISRVGTNIRVDEIGTPRLWDYPASLVGRVEFQGGAGNDRFINAAINLPVRALGGGGNDYLQGNEANDVIAGGEGHDELVGGGSNDDIWGGNGNDVLRGLAGNDLLRGEAGDDYIHGATGDDDVWGGGGADVLLGGDGNDQLLGGPGHDRLNGHGGMDELLGEDGDDVLISIDAAFSDYIASGVGSDVLWIDRVGASRDNTVDMTSSDVVRLVTEFANGADRTLNGDNITDPTDIGVKLRFANAVGAGNTQGTNPLFSSQGPAMTDITQGNLNDCWLLAGLGAIAHDNPHALRQYVVDFDDGTYGVRLGSYLYRVDNELPVWNTQNNATTSNLRFAELGAQNSMWVAVVEKAYAHYRYQAFGAHSYASLEFGWSRDVNRAFGSTSDGEKSIKSYSSAAALANDIANRFNTLQAVTIGFTGSLTGGVPLIPGHMYMIAGINRNAAGAITSIVLQNPHGANTQQYGVTIALTPSQIFAQIGRVNWGLV
jgi:hypothetical protein